VQTVALIQQAGINRSKRNQKDRSLTVTARQISEIIEALDLAGDAAKGS
jgi:hypothetical protein